MRLAACTSISSILYELSSSLMRCARAGVNRLQVAGSLRRSYMAAENVSYTDRLVANASRFAGVVADRCVSVVVGMLFDMVDRTGADELGRLKKGLAGGCGCKGLLRSGECCGEVSGDSSVTDESKDSGGRVGGVLVKWDE